MGLINRIIIYIKYAIAVFNINTHNSSTKKSDKSTIIYMWHFTGTPVFELFSIEIYRRIQKKEKSIILYDDSRYTDKVFIHNIKKLLNYFILIILKIDYISINKSSKRVIKPCTEVYNKILSNTHIHFTGSELPNNNGFNKKVFIKSLHKLDNYLYQNLPNYNNSKFVVPSGIYGSTNLLTLRLNEKKITYFTYDSSDMILKSCKNGIISQNENIGDLFYKIINDHNLNNFVQQSALKLLSHRKSSIIDNITEAVYSDYYLILPNVPWDGAAINKHIIYSSTLDWILDTVNWVLSNTKNNIIIRKHPHLNLSYLGDGDNLADILGSYFESNRILVIEPNSSISTYNLIAKAKLVIGHTTTALLESSILKKPTITVSDAYYSKYKTMIAPKSKQEYYENLKDQSDVTSDMLSEFRCNALICYYISQLCSSFNTYLTPFYHNMKEYIKDNMDQDNVFIESIINDVDMRELLHVKNIYLSK